MSLWEDERETFKAIDIVPGDCMKVESMVRPGFQNSVVGIGNHYDYVFSC